MREKYCICSEKLCLIPYEKEHVPTYNGWLKSEFLQQMTGSEAVSLEEEFLMQQDWQSNQNSLIFIIIDRSLLDIDPSELNCLSDIIKYTLKGVVGDVNLFNFNSIEENIEPEIEVMLGEPTSRGKGLGKEALKMLMNFSSQKLNNHKFEAKIKLENASSIKLFENLNFKEFSVSEIFQETTMRLNLTDKTGFNNMFPGFQMQIKQY